MPKPPVHGFTTVKVNVLVDSGRCVTVAAAGADPTHMQAKADSEVTAVNATRRALGGIWFPSRTDVDTPSRNDARPARPVPIFYLRVSNLLVNARAPRGARRVPMVARRPLPSQLLCASLQHRLGRCPSLVARAAYSR